MIRSMLKSKIHRARVTDTNINYEGSITIDTRLMKAADILPFEQVAVVNVNNGARFTTYVIEGKEGSGDMCLNGAAARLAVQGDIVIVISYADMTTEEALNYKPRVVHVNARNEQIKYDRQTVQKALEHMDISELDDKLRW